MLLSKPQVGADVAVVNDEARPPHPPGVTLEVFVPGRLQSTVNGTLSHAHWSARSRYAKRWRYDVAGRVRLAMKAAGWTAAPEVPKHITLVALVNNWLDTAGLSSALKPVEDGLQTERIQVVRGVPRLLPGAGIIDDDSPRRPHVIIHDQKIARPHKRDPKARFSPMVDPRGVRITITLREGDPRESARRASPPDPGDR